MKYYIATKTENAAEHNRLRDLLNSMGHECTYDWTLHGSQHTAGLARLEEVAQLEHEGVHNCDMLIMLWPGGRGTHVELGMGIALGKACFIISNVEGHHQSTEQTTCFYHHPHVMMFRTVTEFHRRILLNEAGSLKRPSHH